MRISMASRVVKPVSRKGCSPLLCCPLLSRRNKVIGHGKEAAEEMYLFEVQFRNLGIPSIDLKQNLTVTESFL